MRYPESEAGGSIKASIEHAESHHPLELAPLLTHDDQCYMREVSAAGITPPGPLGVAD